MKVRELNDIIERRYGDPALFLSNVRRWLYEHKITQLQVAAEAGLDPSNLNRWLNGHVAPSLKNMLIIDEALERLIDDQVAGARV
jgi:transcriptional regulator with XRE-family HTH domain